MKVGEFFVDLGINATPGASTLKDFMGGMLGMKMSTLSTIGALGTIGNYIMGTVDMAGNAAIAFQKFGNQTGLSAQELQRWQIVAKQANVSTETVASSVLNLQSNLAKIRLTGQGIKPFQILGVSPLGNAFDILTQLRARMGQVAPDVFTNLIQEMGLSPDMVNVLKLSDREFQNFLSTAHGMTPTVQSDVLQMVEAFNKLWLKIKDVNYEIANMAAGPLTKLFNIESDALDVVTKSTGEEKVRAILGNSITDFFKETNRGWEKKKEERRLYQIRVTAGGDAKTVGAIKEFSGDLERALNETEAQTPPSESR